jgi:CHAT domain-containing protein
LIAPPDQPEAIETPEPSNRVESNTGPRILVVTQPATPGLDPLRGTLAEAEQIASHFAHDVTRLDDAHATVAAVVAAMPAHDWAHFACHGVQDAREPTRSALCLFDGALELAQLMDMALPRARMQLAVLSACQSARGDEQLPEEAVHLAAGMLAAGYQSVVATMWSIEDDDGPVLADVLYAALKRQLERRERSGRTEVAYALHEAVLNLQQKVGVKNFVRWVPFIHLGA